MRLVLAVVLWASLALAKVTNRQWLDAARDGYITLVTQFYEESPELLNVQDLVTGTTALIEAALNDHTSVVKYLVALPNIDLNLHEKKGEQMSAIEVAIKNGNEKIFAILAPLVDLNIENSAIGGLRPIHAACAGNLPGHVTILKSLLKDYSLSPLDKSKADVDCVDQIMRALRPNQFRPSQQLTKEAMIHKREMILACLPFGCGQSLREEEISQMNLTVKEVRKRVPLPKEHFPVIRGDLDANERFSEAVQRGNVNWAVHEIKEHKAFVNMRHPQSKQTAFMTSALKGNALLMEKLLELGADPLIPEENGYTAFHGAGFQGQAMVAKMLCEKVPELDPNDMHKDGYRPIHRACWGKNDKHAHFIQALVQFCGVDVESPTRTGLTPLQVLASNQGSKNKQTAHTLFLLGADVSKLSEADRLALDLSNSQDDETATCPA